MTAVAVGAALRWRGTGVSPRSRSSTITRFNARPAADGSAGGAVRPSSVGSVGSVGPVEPAEPTGVRDVVNDAGDADDADDGDSLTAVSFP